MVSRLQSIATGRIVLDYAMFLFSRVELVFSTPKQHRAGKDGQHADDLRVRKAQEYARVDADNFHQIARDARQNQIAAENETFILRAAQKFAAQIPEKCANRAPGQEFVDGRWMHFTVFWPSPLNARPSGASGGHDAVGKAHAPRQRRGLAVVAIAGEQAAHTPDGVAECTRGRKGIEKSQQRKPGTLTQNEKGQETAKQSSEPSETVAIED